MFKKIVLVSLFSVNIIFGSNAPSMDMNSIMSSISSNQNISSEDGKKKTYKELIDGLSHSFVGEHAMLLATIYLNGMSEPDSEGKTIKQDIKKSIKYFEKSINLEYFKSAAMLGSLYLFDNRFENETDRINKAKHYLKIAVDNGIYKATTALASIYFYYEKNTNEGIKTLYLGAKHNNASAQLMLATLYAYSSKDLGIEKNLILANEFLEKACLNKNKTKKVEEFCSSKNVLNYKKNNEVK